MKIAIIGSGISGLTAAYVLSRRHEITVFEKADRIGGHTATVDVTLPDGERQSIDTGFIVYNDWTYPNFINLLGQLGIKGKPTEMSFSVHCDRSGLEYSGSNLNTLFCQRKNLLRPSFWRMVQDILRFNREAILDLESGRLAPDMTLGSYLEENNYGIEFCRDYLVPMGAAIWSASTQVMLEFPLVFFVRFFKNHGLLSVSNRPQWYVIPGGSRAYLAPLTHSFQDRIRTRVRITSVRREEQRVLITSEYGQESFDQVIFACHSDEALELLADAWAIEKQILGAIPYHMNDVVLHTDTNLLPQKRLAWSSWNYHLTAEQQPHAVLTYNMNILQGLASRHTFCVTLNHSAAIDPTKILGRFSYSHPVFTLEGAAAQQRWQDINGIRRTWFCGAYWRNGFHEDGVVSALQVCNALGESL